MERIKGVRARKISAQKVKKVFDQNNIEVPSEAKIANGQMFLQNSRTSAVIMSEGVGQLEKNGMLPVYVNFFGYEPVMLPTQLVAQCITTETIDIADGIRTHNDRLYQNWYNWYSLFKE